LPYISIPLTAVGGGITEANLQTTNSVRIDGTANNNFLPTEGAVATQISRIDGILEDKLDNLGAGAANAIVTSDALGGIQRGLTVSGALNSVSPNAGTILNEVAIKDALDAVASSAQLVWIVD